MINHARTLILNRSDKNRPSYGVDGEEFIPEEYKQLATPAEIKKIRDSMLGTAGDPLYENYILYILMHVLHSVDVSRDYILGLDPRYTYDSRGKNPVSIIDSVAVLPRAENDMSIRVIGLADADEQLGIASH